MSEAVATPPAPKKKFAKLILLVLGGVLLAAGGAGGAWFALGGRPAAAAHAPEPEAPKKPLFTTLEPFTVNLHDPRGERFAQVGVTLQFDDPDMEATIKDRLPAVRNNILMLISSKQMEELLTVEGKQALADQIRTQAGRALGVEPKAVGKDGKPVENPIRQILFSQFIVQ